MFHLPPALKAKGDQAEAAFRAWLNQSGVAFLYVEQSPLNVPDKLRGHAACAYLVLAEGQELDKRKLRDYLSARLASYKVPKDFYRLESLPKNPTGKVLKRVLREKTLTNKK